MAQTIKLKRSSIAGRAPTVNDLELGEVAINTYDGKMYIKKDVSGTETIVEVGAGAEAQTAVWKEYAYTATSGQTTFSGTDDNSETLTYLPGFIQVFLNGILLDPATDYTATSGASVVLTSAAALNDLLQIASFVKVLGSGDQVTDEFIGDNSTVAFTLSANPDNENNTIVFIDGVYQEKATYSVSGTTLTFSTAPYTGASIEVIVASRNVTVQGVEGLTLNRVQFNTDQAGSTAVGEIAWNTDTDTLELGLNADVNLELGEQNYFQVKAGESLSKGDVVYASGAVGNSSKIEVSKYIANNTIEEKYVLGIVAEDIANGEFGFVISLGTLRGLQTNGQNLTTPETWVEGNVLYASPSVAGELTNVEPSAPNQAIPIAFVVSAHSGNGALAVRAYSLGYHLGEIHDVAISSVADNDILQWNASASRWENAAGTTSNIAEGTNLYWTTARGDSNFTTNLAASDTDDLSEGSTNLYYTSARANTDFDTRLATKSTTDLSEGTNLYYTTARFDTAFSGKSTTDLSEGTNLYYTDARFDTRLGTKSTTDLAEGTNLYYTDTRFDTRLGTKTTDNLSEGSTNLYYTSARANTDFDTRLATKTTDNLSEGTTNLYYTDARVGSYLTSNSYATQSYVSTAISNLVDSAPATLDTLNELAAALGDDANFSTTVTNSIALKQDASTALTTSTTFGGDVSGTYNAIVVADDSHNHVISNVDGLQTALDAKQDASNALTTSNYTSTLNAVYANLTGDTFTGNVLFSDSGTTKRGVRGIVGTNDYWFFGGGATASNAGYVEIAAGDDGSTAGSYEPIYVRQYLGDPLTGTVQRTLTLLDNNGNTSMPGDLTIVGGEGFNAAGETASIFLGDSASEIRATYGGGTQFFVNGTSRIEIEGSTGNLNVKTGTIEIAGTTVIDTARNFSGGKIDLSGTGASTDAPIEISVTNSSAFLHYLNAIASSMTAGQGLNAYVGYDKSLNNAAHFGFKYASSQSTSNFATVGFWGNDDLFRVYASGHGQFVSAGRSLTIGGSTTTGPSASVATQSGYLEILAGSGSTTSSSGVVFHNPSISTAALEYVNTDANNGFFQFKSDDTNWELRAGKVTLSDELLLPAVHSKAKIRLHGTNGAELIGTSGSTLELSGGSINFNGADGSGTPTLKMAGTTIVSSARVLQNVSIDGGLINGGTVALARLPGNLSSIASPSVDSGIYFRDTNEKISGETYATAFYAYNANDGFLFLNRDGSDNAKAVFHIGGYNNAPSAGYASEDTVITISRNDGAKADNLATGLSASSYRTQIVKTATETLFNDTQGRHRFDDALRVDGLSELRYIEIERSQTNAALFFAGSRSGSPDANHVLWNDYYGGPTTKGAANSGFDGMKWNTYRGLHVRGGLSGAYDIARFDTDGGGNTNTHYVRLYQANAERFRTTSDGISVTGAVQMAGTTVIDSSRNVFAARLKATTAVQPGSTGYWKLRDNGGGAQLVAEYSTSDALSDANIKWRVLNDGTTQQAGALQMGSTTVIDSSRNLLNISGITASHAATTPFFLKKTSNATHNGVAMLVENQYGNHSWGMVGEMRVAGDAGGDDPSLLFSQGYNSNTWSVGFGYNDHINFRINRDHGHRNGGWGAAMMTMDRSGNVTFAGNVTAYSDERLKENIQTIPNALEAVKQLRGVTYNWKETGEQGLGVIAQEVEAVEVTKCLVSETPESGESEFRQKNVAYGNMVGLLIEAIKEQQTQIEALQAEIKEIKNGNH